MKKLLSILFLSLGLVAATAHASPAAPVSGKDYTVLATPQPTDVPAGKIEVTEFFWYGCPHCNEFDPYLEAWIKKQGPDVVFKRVPVAFRDDFIPHSKMFHALDALGLAQVQQLWAADAVPPDLMWWNTTITDTGHHGGGPYSEQARAALRDADARLCAFLDLLAERDLLAETAILLTADHGSEAADPTCQGDWGAALRAAGVRFRDEGYGFLYLGVDIVDIVEQPGG